MAGARFLARDPVGRLWESKRRGMYISNGAALAESANPRAAPAAARPLHHGPLALPRLYPGYSKPRSEGRADWAILKAGPPIRRGYLEVADPREPPSIEFNYFDPGAPEGNDLKAVAAAVAMVRDAAAPLLESGLVTEEICPGGDVRGEALERWIRDNAWGHHASCTCPMGPRDKGGVLDSRLRVHGVPRLRVVDASIFPRIPGYFIVSAIYMAAEKAADMILEDAVLAPVKMEEAA